MVTEMLNSPESKKRDLAEAISAISALVKEIALTAPEEGTMAVREFPVGDPGSKIVVARKRTDNVYEPESVVSKFTLPASGDKKLLKRVTYRWASNFPDTRDLQMYESIDPDAKAEGRPVMNKHQGFEEIDVDNLCELVTSAMEIMRADD